MINNWTFFGKPAKNYLRTYESTGKIATGQEDDYITGCLIGYQYFKENSKLTAIDLNKQQALDGDPKAMQSINFARNLERAGNTTTFFIIEKVK